MPTVSADVRATLGTQATGASKTLATRRVQSFAATSVCHHLKVWANATVNVTTDATEQIANSTLVTTLQAKLCVTTEETSIPAQTTMSVGVLVTRTRVGRTQATLI